MYNKELKQFLIDGLPKEQVTGKGTGKVTRIHGDLVNNKIIEESLNEIRASMMVQDEDKLDACQQLVLILLNYT
jgi:hypothetical protein